MTEPPEQKDYSDQLYRYVKESLDKEESFHFLGFEMLQRLNIAQLQLRLAEIKESVKEKGKYSVDPTKTHELKEALIDYGKHL